MFKKIIIPILLLIYPVVLFADSFYLKPWEIEPVIKKLEQLTKRYIPRNKYNFNNSQKLESYMRKQGVSVKLRKVGHNNSYGINIVKDIRGRVLIIPVPGSTLWRSGLKTYAILSTIDGKEIAGKRISELISKLKTNNKITITYYQNKNLRKETLKRKKQRFISLKLKRIHSTLVIQIDRFLEGQIYDLFIEELSKYNLAKINHIILDLRYNRGGSIDEAMMIAGHFIQYPVNAGYLKLYNVGVIPITSIPTKNLRLKNKKLSVIMSRFTASSAELFIRAIQHKNHLTTYGEKTYGKCKTNIKIKATPTISISYINGDLLDKRKVGCRGQDVVSKRMSIYPQKKIKLTELFSRNLYRNIIQ